MRRTLVGIGLIGVVAAGCGSAPPAPTAAPPSAPPASAPPQLTDLQLGQEQACAGALATRVGIDMNEITVSSRDTAADGNAKIFLQWGERDQASCEVDEVFLVNDLEPLGPTTFPATSSNHTAPHSHAAHPHPVAKPRKPAAEAARPHAKAAANDVLIGQEQACAGALARKANIDMNEVTVYNHEPAPNGNTVVFLKWNANDQADCEIDGQLNVKSLQPVGATSFAAPARPRTDNHAAHPHPVAEKAPATPSAGTEGASLEAKEQACAGAVSERVNVDMNEVTVNSHDTAADGNTVVFLAWGERDHASCEIDAQLNVRGLQPLGVTTF